MAAVDHHNDVRVELIRDAEDFKQCFVCLAEAFGRQANDNIWISSNPGWDTPEGARKNTESMIDRWHKSNNNTLHLKATIQDTDQPESRRIVGFAIWSQLSMIPGQGEKPHDWKPSDFEAQHPGNEPEQRYICQMLSSLQRHRRTYVSEKAEGTPPSVMALDICAVHPRFQRRGIASKLVEWGLKEAKQRGDLEAITEASSMGRHVYVKLGFEPQGSEIEFPVDENFADRSAPPNVFMRTGRN
jgi:GNAT superfamily N-acetyltransferase